MPAVTMPAHKKGDYLVDYDEKVFEDVKAEPGEKALVTFHTVAFEGSIGLVNILQALRLQRKGFKTTVLLYGPGVTLGVQRGLSGHLGHADDQIGFARGSVIEVDPHARPDFLDARDGVTEDPLDPSVQRAVDRGRQVGAPHACVATVEQPAERLGRGLDRPVPVALAPRCARGHRRLSRSRCSRPVGCDCDAEGVCAAAILAWNSNDHITVTAFDCDGAVGVIVTTGTNTGLEHLRREMDRSVSSILRRTACLHRD